MSTCGCRSWGNNLTKFKYGDITVKKGEKYLRLYHAWCAMRKRCGENNHDYKDYGARGIKVCDEWLNDYNTFKQWSLDNGFDDNLTGLEQSLDRIDVNGNYCPENCRWTDKFTQARNKTNTIYLEMDGIKKPLVEWCVIYNVPYARTLYRYHHNVRGASLFTEKYKIKGDY